MPQPNPQTPRSPGASQAPDTAPRSRTTPLAARGEPMLWLTGAAMGVCLLMIVTLLGAILVHGCASFWPRPIDTVRFRDGKTLMGVPVRDETYPPGEQERSEIAGQRESGATVLPGAFTPDGRPLRRLYRVGNAEVRGQAFEWVPLHRALSIERDPSAAFIERREWGVWIGTPESLTRADEVPAEQASPTPVGARPSLRSAFEREHAAAMRRQQEIEHLRAVEIGRINEATERSRLRLKQLEIDLARAESPNAGGIGTGMWIIVLAAFIGVSAFAWLVSRTLINARATTSRRLACVGAWAATAGLGLAAILLAPRERLSLQDVAIARTQHEATLSRLGTEYEQVLMRIRALEKANEASRLIVREVETGKAAPARPTTPDEPMRVSQVVRWVEPNALTLSGKLGVYLDRWREFLLDEPREANTEGGIFPVIFGTVVLTLLLSVAVVPFGVIAAIYLREYARQGPITSLLRISINNLAGVPSVVYGVFGLGFFCYTLGKYVDGGPAAPAAPVAWWLALVVVLALIAAAIGFGILRADHRPAAANRNRLLAIATGLAWSLSVVGVIWLVARTPYFHGFFEANLPNPTFGTRGLLWAALTLALLTLPVVIVATEEAIAAVPRSMREASYGCGASKWQTIQRIVLPRAMPGIMTGMILAMARGAGEVAPLMLVGAVKLAPDLPVSTHWPFIHFERSFMHLGFHIYDLGFQSPDAEAAKPLVWTTTLVLIAIVMLLNLGAVRLRTRLRRKFALGVF